MIITFASQKGGVGKTTLAIAFSNFLSEKTDRKINVYDFDFQKSLYKKWLEDEFLPEPKIYDVEVIDGSQNPFTDLESIHKIKESPEINIFDLAGTLDEKYSDLLIQSNFVIVPFEYSDVSVKSVLVFIKLLGFIQSSAKRIFVRSKYDMGYNYLNQKGMDEEIAKFGILIDQPVYKRNCLQTISTRKLTYKQKAAINYPFNEIITYINETLQTTL
jgi:chromosome partitioning protein